MKLQNPTEINPAPTKRPLSKLARITELLFLAIRRQKMLRFLANYFGQSLLTALHPNLPNLLAGRYSGIHGSYE